MHTAAKRLLPIAALLLAGFAANASAQQPGTFGLGSAWPNTPDVSLSPNYHVYRFIKDGVTYIQVNDLHGTPRTAVAVAHGVVLPLPIGSDTNQVDDSLSTATSGETVYKDNSVSLLSAAASEGDGNWKTRVN